MAGPAFGIDQLASLYEPQIAVDQAALQRQMAIAQLLRQQAMTPVDVSGRQIGGMGYRVSPLEGVAKIVQGMMANRQDTANDKARLELAQHMATAMRGAFDGGQQPQPQAPQAAQPSGPQMSTPDNPQFNVPPPQAPQAAPQGSPQQAPQGSAARSPTMADLVRSGIIESIGGNAIAAAQAKQFEPTEFARALRSAGIDPDSAIGRKLQQDQIAKLNNIPSENVRPGGYQRNPVTGEVTQYPQVPIGFQATPNGRGGFNIGPANGGPEAVRASSTAQALGPASIDPVAGFDEKGNPKPLKSRAEVMGFGSANVSPEVQAKRDDTRAQILAAELRKETDPTSRKAIQTEIDNLGGGTATIPKGATYGAPPLGASAGAEAGAKNRQGMMKDDYAALSTQNANAQTVISRLQTIKQLGPEAITGAETDKRDFFNGLLSLGGIKSAVDAKTASDLIDKNASQIALAIGAGSQGTDALRSLALAANPGRHMTNEAMQKAADSLIAPLQATQAKTQLLTPHFSNGDAEAYLSKKQTFEKAADPRIWELHNLPPDAQKAYISKLSPSDAKQLLENRGLLKQMGIFQ